MNTRDVTTRYANCARAQTGRRPPCLLRVPLAPRNRFVTCSQRDKVNAEASFICYRFSRFKCFISLQFLVFNFYFFVFLYFNFYFFIDAGILFPMKLCILCVCNVCTIYTVNYTLMFVTTALIETFLITQILLRIYMKHNFS